MRRAAQATRQRRGSPAGNRRTTCASPWRHDRQEHTNREPAERQSQATPAEEDQDIPRSRAERHGHADLVRALRDGIGKDAVQSDRGEQQREQRERAEQDGVLRRHRQLARHDLFDRLDLRHWLVLVDGPDRVRSRRNYRRGSTAVRTTLPLGWSPVWSACSCTR